MNTNCDCAICLHVGNTGNMSDTNMTIATVQELFRLSTCLPCIERFSTKCNIRPSIASMDKIITDHIMYEPVDTYKDLKQFMDKFEYVMTHQRCADIAQKVCGEDESYVCLLNDLLRACIIDKEIYTPLRERFYMFREAKRVIESLTDIFSYDFKYTSDVDRGVRMLRKISGAIAEFQ